MPWNQIEDTDLEKMKQNLVKLTQGAAPEQPVPAEATPEMQPGAVQMGGSPENDAIAQMQAQNLARAQADPAIAAKLAAVQEAIKRQQALQAAKLQTLPKLQGTPGGLASPSAGRIGQTYPAEE
jgi:hypothetical protein